MKVGSKSLSLKKKKTKKVEQTESEINKKYLEDKREESNN